MILRRAMPDEAPFVVKSWLHSYASSDWALMNTPKDERHTRQCGECGAAQLLSRKLNGGMMVPCAGEQYWRGHRALVERLFVTCNVTVAVADDGLLDGFIARDCYEPVLHYVFVRDSARGRGVARALVADLIGEPAVFTHKARGIKKARLPRAWTHSMFPLMGVNA